MTVFNRKAIDDRVVPRTVDDQRFARQRRRRSVAGLFEAMLCGPQVITVKNPRFIAGEVMGGKAPKCRCLATTRAKEY